jgi:hypothetical protein
MATSIDGSVAVGYVSCTERLSGQGFVSIGAYAGSFNRGGDYGINIGYYSGAGTTGENLGSDRSIMLGAYSGMQCKGDDCFGAGWEALYACLGNDIIGIGYQAGNGLTSATAQGCIFIGRRAGTDGQKVDAVNSIAIGTEAYTSANNQVVIGSSTIESTVLRGSISGPNGMTFTTATYVSEQTPSIVNYAGFTVIGGGLGLHLHGSTGRQQLFSESGTLLDARLSASVARRDQSNTFSGDGDFVGHLTSTFQSLSSNPTTTNLSAGQCRIIKNTTLDELQLWANDAGTLRTIGGGGSGTIGGSTGSVDSRILVASGTGGATLQARPVTIDVSGNISTSGNLTASRLTASLNNTDFTNTGGAGSHLVFNNPATSGGQNVVSSIINGNIVCKWRVDSSGNVNWAAYASTPSTGHIFFPTGDYPNTAKLKVTQNGVLVGSDIATTAKSSGTDLQVVGSAEIGGSLNLTNLTGSGDFKIYNTYTSPSVYERGYVRWAGNALEIGTEHLGANVRQLITKINGVTTHIVEQGRVLFFVSPSVGNGVHLVFSNGVNYSRGLSVGGTGIAITDGSSGGESLEFREMTAPSAPSTNGLRIYAEDNGSGKTRLMARFATGIAQQIAIEP